jgi:hypothetical protein
LSNREFARRDALAGVLHAARFKDALNLSILAEGSVDRIKRDLDISRHHEVGTGDINLGHVRAKLPQRLRHASARRERNFALGTGTAHEDGDFLCASDQWTWKADHVKMLHCQHSALGAPSHS